MAILRTNFNLSSDQDVYYGKVRDVYRSHGLFISVASDRISAFDHILPRAIPHKGQVLNQLAVHFLEASRDIVPNWLLASPDPNISVGHACEPIMLEMVIRGCLAGHAWRTYHSGERVLCGVQMPDGMKEGAHFPIPIITPATKAEEGHDEDISKDEILKQKIVGEELYQKMEDATHALFKRGQKMALEQGLILVDTKYEFGLYNGELYLMDEIHTPDSSRYYIADGYEDRIANDEQQLQLSKEFVREWLMENGFQGKEGQEMPVMPDEFVDLVSERYIDLYQRLTGKAFIKYDDVGINDRMQRNIMTYLAQSN